MDGVFQNLDLLSVGIAVAATVFLGFTVYVTNTKNVTNRTFFQFSLITALWGVVNYLSYQSSDPTLVLWLLRAVLFFAVLQAFFLYRLFLVFPESEFTFSYKHMYVLIPLVAMAAIITLSPFAFESILGAVHAGQVAIVTPGPGLGIFALVAIGLVLGALYQLIRKLHAARGTLHSALLILLGGVALMFILIILFNLIIATVFVNPRFIPLGALFTFPFIAAASYAILREHLFNIKVIGTTILVFLLSVASFTEIIFSNTLVLILFRTSIFLLVLVFGVSLIRGVLREVEQREKIEKLAKELEETNERQEGLIHFISHEVKGFLARYMGAFSGLVDGDYGQIPDAAKDITSALLEQSRKDSRMVMGLLQASNLKKGTVSFQMEPFDVKEVVMSIIDKLRPSAETKGLALNVSIPDGTYTVVGDKEKLGDHVFQNLIENSINYTPQGSITVSLEQKDGRVIFEVSDTGIGLSDDDKSRLFTEGGHGKEASKINVHSTGYGLYIAKSTVEAHHGTIRAESEGSGKGSQFIAELPITQPAITPSTSIPST